MTTKETTSPEVLRAAVMEARHRLVQALRAVAWMLAFETDVAALGYLSAGTLHAWREAVSRVLFAVCVGRPARATRKDATKHDAILAAAREVERLLDVLLAAFMRERWPEDTPPITVDKPSREPYQETTDRERGDR